MGAAFILKKADLAIIIFDLSKEFATGTAEVWVNYVKRNSDHADIILIGTNCCKNSLDVDENNRCLQDFAITSQLHYFPADYNMGEGINPIREHLYERAKNFVYLKMKAFFHPLIFQYIPIRISVAKQF